MEKTRYQEQTEITQCRDFERETEYKGSGERNFKLVIEKDIEEYGYTAALDEIMVHGDGDTPDEAIDDLAANAMEYASLYFDNLDFYRQQPDRGSHEPYLLRIKECTDKNEVIRMITSKMNNGISTVGELIEELEKLPQDAKIKLPYFYKPDFGMMRTLLCTIKSVEHCYDMDSNKVIYYFIPKFDEDGSADQKPVRDDRKYKSFIMSKEFFEGLKNVGKKPYFETNKGLNEMADKAYELLMNNKKAKDR